MRCLHRPDRPALGAADRPDGDRRLDDADDYLRQEVESALASDVRVVPVCVQGADLPSADVLPPSLAPLVERQGTKLGDASWHDDVKRLVRRLEGRPPRRRTRTLLVAAAVGVLALVGVAVALALQDNDEPSLSEPEQRLVSSITGAAPAPDACGPRSSTSPEADASVNCDPAAHVVTEYHQFPTPEAAQRWFDQSRAQRRRRGRLRAGSLRRAGASAGCQPVLR